MWKNERCASGEVSFLWRTKCFTPLCRSANLRSFRTSSTFTFRKPFRLVPSPTTPCRVCRTVTCSFSCWCLHLNSDTPRIQSNLFPSAVALRESAVATLFSCQSYDCEYSRSTNPASIPLVPSQGLSNDAKPPCLFIINNFGKDFIRR